MKKEPKVKTPEWILRGYGSPAEYNKAQGNKNKKSGKTFKIRRCPKCGSDDVQSRKQFIQENAHSAELDI